MTQTQTEISLSVFKIPVMGHLRLHHGGVKMALETK